VALPPDPLTRGSAPRSRWGRTPRLPIIGASHLYCILLQLSGIEFTFLAEFTKFVKICYIAITQLQEMRHAFSALKVNLMICAVQIHILLTYLLTY